MSCSTCWTRLSIARATSHPFRIDPAQLDVGRHCVRE